MMGCSLQGNINGATRSLLHLNVHFMAAEASSPCTGQR